MPNGKKTYLDDHGNPTAAPVYLDDQGNPTGAPSTPAPAGPGPHEKAMKPSLYSRLTSPYDPNATNVPERVLGSIGGAVLSTPEGIYDQVKDIMAQPDPSGGLVPGMQVGESIAHQLAPAYRLFAPKWLGGSPEPVNWKAVKGVLPEALGTGIGNVAVGEVMPKIVKGAGEASDMAGRVLDKPALQSGARDVMANKLDTLQKSIQDEATSRYNEIKAADTADWQAKLEAHKKALAEHTEKLKDPSYKGKPPVRPSLGMPIADIQGAMDKKLSNISAESRARMPRLEAAAKEIQSAEATPDFAHLQTLHHTLYDLAKGTSDSYEQAAISAAEKEAKNMMEARAKELGHSDTLSEANKKYALSSAIRDARKGSPRPADAYKKLADVTDKDIADTIKAAGPSGERVTAALKEMKPLANIQKPYGPLGRIAVFKEHPVAATTGSALGAATLGPLMPGFGHIMGMYAGALGAGELMDRIAAAKLLKKAGK